MRCTLVIVAALLMLLSSLAHGFAGWAAMRGGLEQAGAPADLTGALGAGWVWGSVTMAGFGLIALLGGLRLRRGDGSGVAAVRVVALCYVSFGACAFFLRDYNPHFLLFVLTGLLAGLPTIGAGARRTT